MNTNFTEDQKAYIQLCADKFWAAIAAGPQGQIEDGDSPEKIALMNKLLSSESAREEFLEGAISWAAECKKKQDEWNDEIDYMHFVMTEEQKECPYSHDWGDLDEEGCVHCGFYEK